MKTVNMYDPKQLEQIIEVKQKMEASIPAEVLEKEGMTIYDCLSSLLLTQNEFLPEMPLIDVWEKQEKDSFIKYGMSHFDAGYCGRNKVEGK